MVIDGQLRVGQGLHGALRRHLHGLQVRVGRRLPVDLGRGGRKGRDAHRGEPAALPEEVQLLAGGPVDLQRACRPRLLRGMRRRRRVHGQLPGLLRRLLRVDGGAVALQAEPRRGRHRRLPGPGAGLGGRLQGAPAQRHLPGRRRPRGLRRGQGRPRAAHGLLAPGRRGRRRVGGRPPVAAAACEAPPGPGRGRQHPPAGPRGPRRGPLAVGRAGPRGGGRLGADEVRML
mmetsp:Transcript_9067/g.24080  ORF Transcript_9067/g.24080 Transcript_9067/m.24080 type:complete len:230 (-) Transcript_9067:208-897(-)